MALLFWLILAAFLIVLAIWRRDRNRWAQIATQESAARQNLQAALGRQETAHQRLVEWLSRLQKSDPPQLPDMLLDAAVALSGAQAALFLIQDPERLDWIPRAARGLAPGALTGLRISSYDGAPQKTALTTLVPAPALTFLLTSDRRPSGFLALSRPAEGKFTSEGERLVSLLVEQASKILGHARLSSEFRTAYEQAVVMLGRAVEAKDACTFSHQMRTQALARALAQEMQLPEYWIRYIEQGAYLHDVGKIGIPETLLGKTGPLTDEEYAMVKQHPAIGHRLLAPAPALSPMASIILYHHEWFNGKGYPEGLAGAEIPLGARLVQVVDAWDAMTSDRPYRQAMSKSAAIAEMRRCTGTQFDPKIVDVFLKVLERLEREGVPTTETRPTAPAECR